MPSLAGARPRSTDDVEKNDKRWSKKPQRERTRVEIPLRAHSEEQPPSKREAHSITCPDYKKLGHPDRPIRGRRKAEGLLEVITGGGSTKKLQRQQLGRPRAAALYRYRLARVGGLLQNRTPLLNEVIIPDGNEGRPHPGLFNSRHPEPLEKEKSQWSSDYMLSGAYDRCRTFRNQERRKEKEPVAKRSYYGNLVRQKSAPPSASYRTSALA